MRKLILLATILFSTSLLINAQIYVDKDGNVIDQRERTQQSPNRGNVKPQSASTFDKSKLSLGGSFGLQFGDYSIINISPQLGYNFSEHFTAGAGIGYTYSKEKVYVYNEKFNYKRSYASFNIFGRYYPISNIVISAQPEISHMWSSYSGIENSSENKFVPSLVVGGGVRLGPVSAMIKYDVIQDRNSPYGDNIFYSVGYSFGF